jgi:hypothetical protein
MSRQVLIPTQSIDDADQAVQYVGAVASPGDQVVLLVVAPVPEAEFIGTAPPPIAADATVQTTGYAAPRAPDDMPVFVGSEDLMSRRQQEFRDVLAPRLQQLHEKGYDARLDVMFSDSPAATIRDAAGDLDTPDVYVTSDFYSHLETDKSNVSRIIPGT